MPRWAGAASRAAWRGLLVIRNWLHVWICCCTAHEGTALATAQHRAGVRQTLDSSLFVLPARLAPAPLQPPHHRAPPATAGDGQGAEEGAGAAAGPPHQPGRTVRGCEPPCWTALPPPPMLLPLPPREATAAQQGGRASHCCRCPLFPALLAHIPLHLTSLLLLPRGPNTTTHEGRWWPRR